MLAGAVSVVTLTEPWSLAASRRQGCVIRNQLAPIREHIAVGIGCPITPGGTCEMLE